MSNKKKVSGKKPLKSKRSKPAVKKQALKTHIALVLDQSASMGVIKPEAINFFNEQVEQIASDSKGLDSRISLIVFNHTVDVKFLDETIDRLKPLTNKTYNPNGSTAMYDAVGTTIDRMEKEIADSKAEDTAFLVVIISDGQENASTHYNRADVAERIQRLQETKRWTFSYLGANQDLSQITADLNIPAGNTAAFVASAAGMNQATHLAVQSTSRYLGLRKAGVTSVGDYYTTPDEISKNITTSGSNT